MTVGLLGQPVDVIDRFALLLSGELCLRQRSGEAVITLLATGEHEQVPPLWVRLPVLRFGEFEGELRAVHRLDVVGRGCFGQSYDPVQPVMVGEADRMQPQSDRFLHEFLRVAGAVEEAEVGVAVQFGIRDRRF